jgi:3-isopropylmalate/(R)-2-methylmalate dehydratase small subunit
LEKFVRMRAVAVPMDQPNIDTDQIIPARFFQKPRNRGLQDYLFHDLRFDREGRARASFVLNRPDYLGASILVAERNFGCGSSREAAVYALWDYGFRVVIAPSFSDIFVNNCFVNGMLPVVLEATDVAVLLAQLQRRSGPEVEVDLAAQSVTSPSGTCFGFEVDPYRKKCLLDGLDELDYTLGNLPHIADFELASTVRQPWLKA